MKKFFTILLSLMLMVIGGISLVGCKDNNEQVINIYMPDGAPALSMSKLMYDNDQFDTEVNYTVGLWDDEQSTSTNSGTFVIGENNKYFELYKNSEDWRFVLDPKGMKNTLGKTYKISISFKVNVPGTDKYVVLTSADVPSFEGTVTYFETD